VTTKIIYAFPDYRLEDYSSYVLALEQNLETESSVYKSTMLDGIYAFLATEQKEV